MPTTPSRHTSRVFGGNLRRRVPPAAWSATLLLAASIAAAASDGDGGEPVEDPALAETIVVTAARAEQELGQVTASVSVVTGDELRASAAA